MFRWRREMGGISYWDMMETPIHIIVEDLQMIQLEQKYQSKANQNENTQGIIHHGN